MSTSASSTTLSSLDHLPPSEQLCYVHCSLCDTVLAVSVPSNSLFQTVTVRCGHCANLLPVNMCGLPLPTSVNDLQHHLGHTFFPHPSPNQSSVEEHSRPSCLMNQQCNKTNDVIVMSRGGRLDNHSPEIPRPPPPNKRTPEKRQRVPSAYNRFIKEEIQRIKAGNPDISHREAFSAAAKNWAHFPHIHFGLMSDQTMKKTNIRQQDGEDVMMNNGFFASANVGISPY